jgi:hypothetical protein
MSEESGIAEIVIAETGRLAAQFNQIALAEDCQARSNSARSHIAKLHAMLTAAELALGKRLSDEERAEVVATCTHVMSQGMSQGDLVLVHDAAAMLWSHAIRLLKTPQLVKRELLTAADILGKVNSQANLMRSQLHFTLAKLFEQDRDTTKSIDQLKKALALDYLWSDHPTKLIHPFDRFLVPYYRMGSVQLDSYGHQGTPTDEAYALIALPKKINPESLQNAFGILQAISSTDISAFDAVDAAHFASVWIDVIRNASQFGIHQTSVDGCHHFLGIDFESGKFDAAVEIQCEAAVYGVSSCFKITPPNPQYAVQFTQFSLSRSKQLKIARLAYNSITAIWNSYFCEQQPTDCSEYADFLGDCVTHLFESDFADSKSLIGQFVNFYVQTLMAQSPEPPPAIASPVKKKAVSLDPAKQKQLKTAEDLVIKALPLLRSIYEKRALIDRIAEIFGKRNALPPNQTDPENAILLTLATIMNEKVQHKPETLTAAFGQIQSLPTPQPVLFALLAERAIRLDLHQVTIDSATKTLELFADPSSKDEIYYSGLARFYRGLAFLKLIQPDLQEFSCQDKLRTDSANDFLRAAASFHHCKMPENAKLALSYFVSTVMVGEEFQRFRGLLASILVEAIDLSRKVIIGDELRVRIFRIYLLALIDRGDWPACRKLIQHGITTLEKKVHCHIWDLNLIVTANADCAKTQQPLIDEMLRVKQLGDAKYQSRLWSFVADLATDPVVKRTSLRKAIDVLQPTDTKERFQASMDLVRWLHLHADPWPDVESAIDEARMAISGESAELSLEAEFEIAEFKLSSTTQLPAFNRTVQEILGLSARLWMVTVSLNEIPDEEEPPATTKGGKPTAKPKKLTHQGSGKIPTIDDFKQKPGTVAEWTTLFQQVDHHKSPIMSKPFHFVEVLVRICDVLENLGLEFNLLMIWYHILLISKHQIQWARYEQFLFMKLKLFLDRLNVVSPLIYPQEVLLTEAEKTEWAQRVARYAVDPPSQFPPLRRLLTREAELLVDLGDYKSALYLLNAALAQAEQVNDKETKALSIVLIAIVKGRSGEIQSAVELLATSAEIVKMPLQFWVLWYSAGFMIQRSDFTEALLNQFRVKCLKPGLCIAERILVYHLYRTAVDHLLPDTAATMWESVLKDPALVSEAFVPAIDTALAFHWRSIIGENFPRSLPHFQDFGNELKSLITRISDAYNAVVAKSEPASLPLLCRLVDAINLFGAITLKYAPVIRSIEANGLDVRALGSHQSLLGEFINKAQEPLPDLSPTAAILHFNTVQNVRNIPSKYFVKMTVYLGQCLHSISTDTVTLQNAVKYLWKGVLQLIELEQFEHAGEVASEVYAILNGSDVTGSIFQYFVAQAALAYKSRMQSFLEECEPSNREWLFVRESERLRNRFMNPDISPMFTVAQKYFATIPNGTTLVRLSRTMEQIKAWVAANKALTVILLDDLPDFRPHLTAAVITFRDGDKIQAVPIDLDLDEAAMKYEVFKQIIAPTKVTPPADAASRSQASPTTKSRRPVKRAPVKAPIAAPVEDHASSFAKDAVKLNHPEFQKFLADLDGAFDPLKQIFADRPSDTGLFLSSLKNAHVIPLEIVSAFAPFTTLYHDFSIMSALNRKAPSSDPPSYGSAH